MGLWNKIFCCHDWEKREEWEVTTANGGKYTVFLYICKKCGKMKKIRSIE
jgi:hypothetical protein